MIPLEPDEPDNNPTAAAPTSAALSPSSAKENCGSLPDAPLPPLAPGCTDEDMNERLKRLQEEGEALRKEGFEEGRSVGFQEGWACAMEQIKTLRPPAEFRAIDVATPSVRHEGVRRHPTERKT